MALQYIGSNSSTANASSYNFGNFAIPADGLVIVGAAGGGGGSLAQLSSVSIGGTNGTIHVNPSGSSFASGIASRRVTAGDHNVTVTFTSGRPNASCHVWFIADTLVSDTPTDTDGVNTGSNASSSTATLDLPENSIAVYVSVHENNNAVTWTGATERFDQSLDSNMQHSAADKTSASASPGDTVTASWSGSDDYGMSGACWQIAAATVAPKMMHYRRLRI